MNALKLVGTFVVYFVTYRGFLEAADTVAKLVVDKGLELVTKK